VDIVVRGRNVEVPDHYRQHVAEKLSRMERYDHKLIRIDVELHHEKNRRQSQSCQRVQITCRSRGPVVRSEACAADFYSALDAAVSRLENRFRRSADRRRVHHGRHAPQSVAVATARLVEFHLPPSDAARVEGAAHEHDDTHRAGPDTDEPILIVREKEHVSEPMTVEQALHNMELVGHDFYLFWCKETGRPSVVYRRRGFDYGVLRLSESPDLSAMDPPAQSPAQPAATG
jgi:ribosomal subunit interface protein